MKELLCTLDIVRLHLPSPYLYHARKLIERFFDRIKRREVLSESWMREICLRRVVI
jgi:hypothetical protein